MMSPTILKEIEKEVNITHKSYNSVFLLKDLLIYLMLDGVKLIFKRISQCSLSFERM